MAHTLRNLFTDHPASVDETYGEHMLFAGRAGLRLVGAGFAVMVHALLPFLFERTASNLVLAMHADMMARRNGGAGVSEQGQARAA